MAALATAIVDILRATICAHFIVLKTTFTEIPWKRIFNPVKSKQIGTKAGRKKVTSSHQVMARRIAL